MAVPDWVIKQRAACSRAAKAVGADQFKPVRRGLILSRKAVWQRENPLPLARWGNATLVVLDAYNRRRGTLMLITANIAVEVQTDVATLLAVYEPHHEIRWYRDQQQHRCEPVSQRVTAPRRACVSKPLPVPVLP